MNGYCMRKRMRLISSHLDQTSLVNKGFIIWKKDTIFFWGTVGNYSAGSVSSCPPTEVAK